MFETPTFTAPPLDRFGYEDGLPEHTLTALSPQVPKPQLTIQIYFVATLVCTFLSLLTMGGYGLYYFLNEKQQSTDTKGLCYTSLVGLVAALLAMGSAWFTVRKRINFPTDEKISSKFLSRR